MSLMSSDDSALPGAVYVCRPVCFLVAVCFEILAFFCVFVSKLSHSVGQINKAVVLESISGLT